MHKYMKISCVSIAACRKGRAILIHALAHIEFNAINPALDAIWRFADLPREYYSGWLHCAISAKTDRTLPKTGMLTEAISRA